MLQTASPLTRKIPRGGSFLLALPTLGMGLTTFWRVSPSHGPQRPGQPGAVAQPVQPPKRRPQLLQNCIIFPPCSTPKFFRSSNKQTARCPLASRRGPGSAAMLPARGRQPHTGASPPGPASLTGQQVERSVRRRPCHASLPILRPISPVPPSLLQWQPRVATARLPATATARHKVCPLKCCLPRAAFEL